jgi:predicted ribosome quality control (RQC) complex YloA/Tae2 family protein
MDDRSLAEIVAEAAPSLTGRAPGKIFQLGPLSLSIDFRVREGFLFISVDPSLARLHLIKRRVRDLEKQSSPLNQFSLAMRKELSGTTLQSMTKAVGDRIVRFEFSGPDDFGAKRNRTLIAQLTGRSANLFLLDEAGKIIQRARGNEIPGQQIGEAYEPPAAVQRRESKTESELLSQIHSPQFESASEAADSYFSSLLSEKDFAARAAAAHTELRRKIAQQEKLLVELQKDLQSHAGAEQHKLLGDLLLANLSTARRRGKHLTLIDYFAADSATVELELDEAITLPEEAERRFALYSRSKRSVGQINDRLEAVRKNLNDLQSRQRTLEQIISAKNEAALQEFTGSKTMGSTRAKDKAAPKIPGTRRYLSSDGFEILVGRTARDNDHLTFKVARPNDLWLHAADYGGSHVVVRNSTRKEVPQRTLIEAAQLAAHFSQARKDPKVDVHYTERKFLMKSKGAAPGLVRLTRFKNITVSPKEGVERV